MRKIWRKKLIALMIAGFTMTGIFQPVPKAEAVDAWAAAAQALGVFGAYKSSLASILAMGNNVNAQIQSRLQDDKENGLDFNKNDIKIVNQVMNQLTQQGVYVLKNNSLPFIWSVNNSKEFNAACYPTNYVSINKALVRGLNCDIDELAAVLGHEMTHGLEQHSAHNYAKAVAQYYGLSFLNMDTGVMDWNKLNALASYSIAKNVTLPTEYDADEGGFYLMTSAGFNPGGGAAAMARMAYYLTYETQNIMEYQDIDEKNKNQENFNDHPDTELREQKLAKMMSDYGAGHVTVKNRQDIFIDGEKLITAEWTGDSFDNTAENAYYIAGALAKAFHDNDTAADWDFQQTANGNITCLPDIRVNKVLKDFLQRDKAFGSRLQNLIHKAYINEKTSGARDKMKLSSQERLAKIIAEKENALAADIKAVKKMRENADTYSDYGLGAQAIFQMKRVFAAKNIDNEAESYAIRGRAKAVAGDFTGALKDSAKAIELDDKNVYNFLNRADVYHMQGNTAAALADLQKGKELAADNPFNYLMSGQIYDELAEKEKALANYRKYYELKPKAFRDIPMEYLKYIAPQEYDTLRKEHDTARKAQEKAIKAEKEQKKKAQKNSSHEKKTAVKSKKFICS